MTATNQEICTLFQQLNLFTFVTLLTSGPVNKLLLLSIYHGLHCARYLSVFYFFIFFFIYSFN